jgi:hypothetical protein
MRVLAVMLGGLSLALGAGCLHTTEFKCGTSADCGSSGAVCESTGYCSFTDSSCTSGYRYGALSGSYADQCTDGGGGGGDGGVDAPFDGQSDGGGVGCPNGYAALTGVATHQYKLLNVPLDWPTQKSACAADGSNVYLAVPDDNVELAALLAASGGANSVWVGIDDNATEGSFVTSKGAPFSSTSPLWEAGQPDNAQGGQNCVAANANSGKLSDEKCPQSKVAVCECEP